MTAATHSNRKSRSTQSNSSKKSEKQPVARYYANMAKMVNHVSDKLPHFSNKFYLMQLDRNTDQVIEEVDGVCHISSKKRVAQAMVRHIEQYLKGQTNYEWDFEKCKKAVEYWESVTSAVERPADVLFASDFGKTFRRLPFNLPPAVDPKADCPLFMEIISRMGNADAFVAWFGSLFVPESYRQQYIWLKGDGNDSKGSLLELLEYIFGQSLQGYQSTPDPKNRFWTYFLLDKRVVAFTDCDDPDFITTAVFKSLTGGDKILAEIKNGGVLNAPINIKIIIASNIAPNITGQTADTRRIIYCPLKAIREEDMRGDDYKEDLKREAPAIIKHCLDFYQAHYANHTRIQPDRELTAELVEESEEYFAGVFENLFVRTSQQQGIVGERMQQILKLHFHNKKEREGFRQYVLRQKVDKRQSKLVDGKNKQCYLGIIERRDYNLREINRDQR